MRVLARTAIILALAALPLAACDDDEKKDQQASSGPAPAASPDAGPAVVPTPAAQTPAPAPAPAASPMPAPAAAMADDVPQAGLIAAVEAARELLSSANRADKAALDAIAAAALAARGQAQCVMVLGKALTATDWTGKVRGVFPMSDTLTLQVEFTRDAFVMTNFGPGLDRNLGKVTSFAKGSPLYDTVAALKPGDSVTFSGTFFPAPDDKGCLIVIPSTQPSEFIDYPTYFFEYTAVSKS